MTLKKSEIKNIILLYIIFSNKFFTDDFFSDAADALDTYECVYMYVLRFGRKKSPQQLHRAAAPFK